RGCRGRRIPSAAAPTREPMRPSRRGGRSRRTGRSLATRGTIAQDARNPPVPEGFRMTDLSQRLELTIAVFVDFENLALGAEQSNKGRFDVSLVMKRLLERGRVVFKRAYCDWSRFQNFTREFHMQGFEMVDIPRS